MSALSSQIRDALGVLATPTTGRALCDAMGVTDPADRRRVVNTVSAMAHNGSGVLRGADGYTLDPEWKPRGRVVAALGYTPGLLDRTAPARVFLQIDTSAHNDERGEPWPGAEGVSWNDEPVGGLEIQYVRADLARTPSAQSGGSKWLELPAFLFHTIPQPQSDASPKADPLAAEKEDLAMLAEAYMAGRADATPQVSGDCECPRDHRGQHIYVCPHVPSFAAFTSKPAGSTEERAQVSGGGEVLTQLRRELAEDKGWDYTQYERGRLEEKRRCVSLLEAAMSTPQVRPDRLGEGGRYWRERAEFWREQAVALGWREKRDAANGEPAPTADGGEEA